MKNILIALFIICALPAIAQNHSCCSLSSTGEFALFASNEKFAASHLDPVPFNFVPAKGSMIGYKMNDGKYAYAFFVRADKPTNNWLLVFHEWWGLNDYIKQEAERLQEELGDVNVLALDLYDSAVAKTAAEAQKLMGNMKEDHVLSIIKGALAYAGPKARIFTIGWCMGGGWSLQASILAGKQGAGCVMYYGMPEKDLARLNMLNADVLGIFAGKDQYITPEIVSQFEKNMKTLKKKLMVKSFDADHAFANPSNPKYDKTATSAANALALSFLKERLKPNAPAPDTKKEAPQKVR